MPVKELMRCLQAPVPANVIEVSDGLIYRDFITVGLLLKKLKIREDTPRGAKLLSDNWIYIQEPDVMVGRMQIFNNWSPYLVADPENVWIGLEYFCNETDDIWKKSDADMIQFAKDEMEKIGIIDGADVLDALRDPRARRPIRRISAPTSGLTRSRIMSSQFDELVSGWPQRHA